MKKLLLIASLFISNIIYGQEPGKYYADSCKYSIDGEALSASSTFFVVNKDRIIVVMGELNPISYRILSKEYNGNNDVLFIVEDDYRETHQFMIGKKDDIYVIIYSGFSSSLFYYCSDVIFY